MKNSKYVIIFLFYFFMPMLWHSIALGDEILIQKQFPRNYHVSIVIDHAKILEKVIIYKNNKLVFQEGGVGEHLYFGNQFDDSLSGKDIYSGTDLNHNGGTNLVISQWTGGAHCCHFLYIFDLGIEFKLIKKIDAGSSKISLKEFDNDQIPEIEFWDGSIDYLFASFAHSPKGRIILKFQQGSYELATHLMRSSIPKSAALKKLKIKIKGQLKAPIGSPELSYDFLKLLMNLSYTGHFEEAMKVIDEVWPNNLSGRNKFKTEFAEALKKSKYWKKF